MAVGKPKFDVFLKGLREEDEGGGLDWQASVLDKDLNDPPGAPNLGDRYIVAPVGINAWAGHDNDIAEWNGANWDFFSPDEGTAAWVEDEDKTYVFNGTAWVTMGSTMLHGNLQGLLVDDHTQYMLREILDGPLSPMILTGGVLSAGTGVGTLKVAVLSALFRTGVLATDPLIRDTMAEQDNIAIPLANTEYVVVLNYNGGAPLVTLQVGEPNGASSFGIGHCLKNGANVVHFCNGGMRLSNGLAKLHRRAYELRNCELAQGCAIGDDTLQRFSIQPGITYYGINRLLPFLAGAYHSLADQFMYIYGDDVNGWTYVPGQTDIDNTQYYDGAGGLAVLTNTTKYACHWVYMHPDDEDVYVVYGTCNGTLAQAEQAQPPSSLPPILEGFTTLLGCIIIKKSDTSFTTIQMVTDRFFTGTAVADHGELAGLDDDDHLQYLLHDGTRAMTGDLDMGAFDIDNVTDVNAAGDVNAARHNIPTKKVDCKVFTSAGVNACLAELGAGGGEVYLPEGTYVCTVPIVIPVANVTLRGAGAGTILDASAGQTFDVITSAKDYTVIADLQVLGDAGGAQTKDLIVITGAYCTVRGCLLKESDHHGLLLSTNNHANVEGNIIEANDNTGISVATFDRIRIRGNQFIGGVVGIDLDSNSQLSLVANNAFTEVTWQSINDDGSSQVIIGNTFRRSGPVDILSNTSVIGNHFHDGINDKNDLNLTGASHNAIVVGNFFYGAIGYSERAISVVNSDNVIIHSNYSYGHDTCGIAIDTNSNFVSLMGNMLRDTTPTVFAGTGQVAHIRSVVVGQQQSFPVNGVKLDLKSVAQTILYIVPTGYRLLVDTAEVLIDAITGAAAMPTIRFGLTGDEGALVGARALDETINEVNARQNWDCPQDGLAAGQVLEFGVTVAGTSTTHMATVFVTGRLLEA